MPDIFHYQTPLDINMLIACASTPSDFEECLKLHVEEMNDVTGDNFVYIAEDVEPDVFVTDGQIMMARRICKMQGIEYDLPDGYTDMMNL